MIEIIAIGDEVLAGHTVNRNAAYISRKLREIGLSVTSHRVIADRRETIKAGVGEALQANSLVICTGGLGPTFDDNTRKAVAELLGCGFHYDEEIAKQLDARFGEHNVGIENQATIPELAKPFHNVVGTAPGLLFEQEKTTLILLPGVPVEMESLLERDILPYLTERFPVGQREATETLHFCQVKELDVDTALRELGAKYPEIKLGIYPSLGVIQVRLSHQGDPDALVPLKKELESRFASYLFHSPDGTLEGAVHERFVSRGLTLSTAESCTGGAIAAALTARPGASDYFLGSIVSYSDAMKANVLGVSSKTLEAHGAVSEEVVREMVRGLVEITQSDYGIAVSGIAGPTGGTAEKPVGTVWVAAIQRHGEPITRLLQAKGDRAANITRSIQEALAELLKLSS